MVRQLLLLASAMSILTTAQASDWPTYRGNAARSGFTSEAIAQKLTLDWSYQKAHAPNPAWPRDLRMAFDWAHHVVVADGRVFFASSADGTVRALDASSGRELWMYFTDGPVRFAPTVWRDRVFAVSDDGFLHALDTATGKLIKKWRGGPKDDRVLGNERIVSKWVARGAAVVVNDVLYWAAGIWQSEGIYIRALNLKTGELVWENKDSGGIYMPQPHGGANAKSGVTAQGYLAADADYLVVPTGRAVPAVFQRDNGQFLYYQLQANTHRGGSFAQVQGPFIYNGGYAYKLSDGALGTPLTGPTCAFAGGTLVAGNGRLQAVAAIEVDAKDRAGKPIKALKHKTLWEVAGVPGGSELIAAGTTAFSANGKTITAVDLEKKAVSWSADVDAEVLGLAVADGRLFASTTSGAIHCFSADASGQVTRHDPSTADVASDERFNAAAKEIVAKTNVTEGYCLDLGCGDGSLALELSRLTKLQIVAIDPDAKNVEAARAKLHAAGLYGIRVTVHQGDLSKTHYPKYFANLIVSARSLSGDVDDLAAIERQRLTRPYGGVVCLGEVGVMQVERRGALKKAGEWTHLYADASNSLCSADEIKGPLSVLWFRDMNLDLPQRHGRGPSPLFHNGRLFVEGLDGLRAVDAYNGRSLWHFEQEGILSAYNADHLAGMAITGSNICLHGDGVFLRNGHQVFRLDAATGKVIAKFSTPASLPSKEDKKLQWGYLACSDGILFGTTANTEHVVKHAYIRADSHMKQQYSESSNLFAYDIATGKLLWRYDAKDSIRHNAIAIAESHVYLIDRALAKDDLLSRAPARRGGKPATPPSGHPTGRLVKLDARTGKSEWVKDKDVYGTTLAVSEEHDIVLMCYQPTRFKLPSEVGGKMAAFHASDGYRLWDKAVSYNTRPLINGNKVIASPSTVELMSGESSSLKLAKSYGCGQLAGSKNLLMFRSGTLGYLDFTREAGTENFGGIRPGCWLNALPVGGLVLVPDASAGCRCSYQNRAWVALEGTD
ncbi:MAG: PQQ-binding-like beta-propeller repeat protein [Planctomycetota bacterium]|nr:PQQ-binding-like beta-propeller repeat protein [Planctomycetota bacterium]